MCTPRVTWQMSRWYSHSRQTLSSMSCVMFPIVVLMHSRNSGNVFGSGGTSRTMFTSHDFQRHYLNCKSASTPQSGTSHKTCLGGLGGNGSNAWTSAVSHEGRTSNAFKVTMKLQRFLFQMLVTSCILFSICENMVLQNSPIIYTHPVLYVTNKFIQNEWQ